MRPDQKQRMTTQVDSTMRTEATIHSSSNKPDADIETSAVSLKHLESQPSDERDQDVIGVAIESAPSVKSDFRQSLEDEAREKERQREMEEERLHQSKTLLRESINASVNSLTRPERNFLESLLELTGPGAAEACATAHQRLLDTDLFWGFAVCAGSAGEVDSLIPGHGWTAASLHSTNSSGDQPQETTKLDGCEKWASQGTPSSTTEKRVLTESDLQKDPSYSDISLSQSTKELIMPYALHRKSSEARLARLEFRKRQSFSGKDANRLYRAHEAGLVVTPGGSAKRSLMRMGIDVERGGAYQDHFGEFIQYPKAPSAFEEELDKMDKRDIKKIDKEQIVRAYSSGSVPQPPGCNSPLSKLASGLKKIYASKQLSFHRQSSSYSRYDSFLEETAQPYFIGSSDTDNAVDNVPAEANDSDIFRPSPKDRLNNLLINAGLKNPSDEGEYLIMDASPTRNFSSTSFNSLDCLLNGGGPSFCEDVVFRDSVDESDAKSDEPGEKVPIPSLMEMIDVNSRESDSKKLEVSPAKSDVGELPSKPPTHSRSSTSTQGIIRSSSTKSPKRRQYSRSVSWSQNMVSAKEDGSVTGAKNDSGSSGLSIISFPSLRRAAPLRSDSIGSTYSMFSFPSIHLAKPLRSDSVGSLLSTHSLACERPSQSRQSSLISAIPAIRPAHPIRSESQLTAISAAPSLRPAHPIRSESQLSVISVTPSLRPARTIRSDSLATNQTTDMTSWEQSDSDRDESFDKSDGRAAWESPMAPSNHQHHIFLREASKNIYQGEGIEIENQPSLESVEKARKYKSMVSQSEYSFHSSRSRQNSSGLLFKSLDDSFIVKNVDFKRQCSEVLRSLSNEDLYSSHHVQTICGGSKNYDVRSTSSVCDNIDDLDLEDNDELTWDVAPNAWSVLSDEYAYGYGGGDTLPFRIIGTTADDATCHPHVLSPPLMESLQNFLPPGVSEQNFWLKYSLVRDGASLFSLLTHIRGAKNTVIAIETVDGEVFGSFTSSPWRKNWSYYGNGDCFLWRMRRTRSDKDLQHSIIDQAKLESELDVYYWTGRNELVQYCTHDMIAIGGGALSDFDTVPSATDEERDSPESIPEFTKTAQGGFGLAIDSDLFRATSSSCATFQNPPLSKVHADGSPFEILNLEVWTLTPTQDVESAENLEMKALFLDSYSGGFEN